MKKPTLAKFNGTLPAKMLAALCVLNCVGAVTPPETHPPTTPVKMEPALGMNSGRALTTAPPPEDCAALNDKKTCRKKDRQTLSTTGAVLAQCGVATVAIYFPGFHQSVDNDMLWGEKWTEWDNLFTQNGSEPLLHDARAHNELLHPQRGYYDIWDGHARTIRAQAQQAAAAGFQAFMFCAPLSNSTTYRRLPPARVRARTRVLRLCMCIHSHRSLLVCVRPHGAHAACRGRPF